ncbi:RHOMBOID protein 12 [Spatholobus suberectus]|nr:RHOMBOID protein 12 [Spatholobus suberectus]
MEKDAFLLQDLSGYSNRISIPVIGQGIFLIGKDMLRIIEGNSQISGSAHLGGAAVAAIAWAGVRKGRF